MTRAIRMKNEGCSTISILRIFKFCLALGVLFAALVPATRAQLSEGTIQGVVKDSSGATVPGANVTVTTRTRTGRARRLLPTMVRTEFQRCSRDTTP